MLNNVKTNEQLSKMSKTELVTFIQQNMNENVEKSIFRRYSAVVGIYQQFDGVTYIKNGRAIDLNADKAVTPLFNVNYILNVFNKQQLIGVIKSRAFRRTYNKN